MIERQSSERYAHPLPDLAEDMDTVMGFPCGAALRDELGHAVLALDGMDATRLTVLDVSAPEGFAVALSTMLVLDESLAAWADQLDMARVAVAPIKALAAHLAEPDFEHERRPSFSWVVTASACSVAAMPVCRAAPACCCSMPDSSIAAVRSGCMCALPGDLRRRASPASASMRPDRRCRGAQ